MLVTVFIQFTTFIPKISEEMGFWASLVAQWLRICLPMQGTWVRSLVREDPTCHGATMSVNLCVYMYQ